MDERTLDGLIKRAYSHWKKGKPANSEAHPDEETLADFIEGRLDPGGSDLVKAHIVACGLCAKAAAVSAMPPEENAVADTLLEKAKGLFPQGSGVLELFLKIRKDCIELLQTSGDVLMGQEFLPAPLLRSRHITDFKDEVTVIKDICGMIVQVKVENKPGREFSLYVLVKEKGSQGAVKDLRITLLKDDLELESYMSDEGKAVFEHVQLGHYRISIDRADGANARVVIDMR